MSPRPGPRLRRGAAILLALLAAPLAGCGALSFQRAWTHFEAPVGTGMAGRWTGEWRSEWNGHAGGLRCLMEREAEGRFRARFLSTYARVFSFQHETVFEVTDVQPGSLHFTGLEDLGAGFGGVYRYDGTVAGDEFHASYSADNGDHGVFEMRRVLAE